MDIHDSENNLGDINNSSENIEVKQNNTDDNLGEMNPYADNTDGIHAPESDDNIVIKIEETNQPENMSHEFLKATILRNIIINNNKKIRAKQIISDRRNDIMRSVAKERFVKTPSVKQMIKAVLPSNTTYMPKHRLNVIRGKSSIKPNKNGNFPTKHSLGNFVRSDPPVPSAQMPLQEPHIFVDNFQIRSDPPNPNMIVTPWCSTTITPDFMRYQNIPQPTIEKPKEVNLAEIVTTALQDVLAGKLTTVENIIGKLRVDFEEKSVFTNSKKRNVILLNFEDDTMRPVLKIEDKYMNIIEQWYNDCDLLIDIEETNVSIPEVITIQDVSGVLFQDINYKFKDEYLNSYIPLVINNIISERSAKCLEKKYFKKPVETKNLSVKNSSTDVYYFEPLNQSKTLQNQPKTPHIMADNVLSDMGIVIPENILPETLKTNSAPNTSSSLTPWNLPDVGKRIDPEILLKKHILADIRKTEVIDNDITPFNEIKSSFTIDNVENNIACYNLQYNVLQPNFGENCLILDDIECDEQSKESNLSSIYVLMNDKFLQTITILDPNADIIHIIKNHPEFGFIKLFGIETNNKDIISFVEREFNNVHFNDVEEINKKLLVTSQYIDFSNKHNDANNMASSEENQVKKFLNSKYTIDNDLNHKMKASTLYDLIINSKVVKIDNDKVSGFRTRLSKYLKDIGLQKKRYNDGFYYYGIVEKEKAAFTMGSGYTRENKLQISLEEIEKRRYQELREFTFELPSEFGAPSDLGISHTDIKNFTKKAAINTSK